jgi:hypothetical protein
MGAGRMHACACKELELELERIGRRWRNCLSSIWQYSTVPGCGLVPAPCCIFIHGHVCMPHPLAALPSCSHAVNACMCAQPQRELTTDESGHAMPLRESERVDDDSRRLACPSPSICICICIFQSSPSIHPSGSGFRLRSRNYYGLPGRGRAGLWTLDSGVGR